MSAASPLRVRRAVVLGVTVVVPIALVVGVDHRGTHMARSLVLPGAGLVGERDMVAAVCFVLAVAATVAWLRWGVDWLLAAVIAGSVLVAGLLTGTSAHAHDTATLQPVSAAHEFPLVVLVVGVVSWIRVSVGRIPGLAWIGRRRNRAMRGLIDIDRLGAVDRSRTAAVLALTGDPDDLAAARVVVGDPALLVRARRVGLAARWRIGGDPLRTDHAATRAALALTGALDAAARDRLLADAARAPLGVPCSEPTWVRPLDAVLAAVAVERAGGSTARFRAALHDELGLRRGHRPMWWWTPLGIGAGSMPAWEHAAVAGIARSMGWIGDDDWQALRQRALGASARGTAHPHDERLVAAARLWAPFVDDEQAHRLLTRPTVGRDPLAVALDRLASHLAGHLAGHLPTPAHAMRDAAGHPPHHSSHDTSEVSA